MKLFYLLFITFASCQGSAINEPLTHECLKYYLKTHQAGEEIIDYVDSYVGSVSDCESSVRGVAAGISNDLRKRLSEDRSSKSYLDCIMRDVEEENDEYEKLKLKELAIEMISNWRFWKYFSKSSRLDEIRAAAENIVQKSLLTCKGHQQFGYYFQQIQERKKSWPRSGEQEYCIRTTLVEMNLLNDRIYNFRPNPRNVPTSNLNCTEVFRQVKEDLLSEIKEEKNLNNCHLKVYRENRYAEFILKAEVLSNLSLTTSDKSKEKQDFINSMVDILIDAKGC